VDFIRIGGNIRGYFGRAAIAIIELVAEMGGDAILVYGICLTIGSSFGYKVRKLIKHGLRPCLIMFCIQFLSGPFTLLNNYSLSNWNEQ